MHFKKYIFILTKFKETTRTKFTEEYFDYKQKSR